VHVLAISAAMLWLLSYAVLTTAAEKNRLPPQGQDGLLGVAVTLK
jgi:hypothetical protein